MQSFVSIGTNLSAVAAYKAGEAADALAAGRADPLKPKDPPTAVTVSHVKCDGVVWYGRIHYPSGFVEGLVVMAERDAERDSYGFWWPKR